MCEFETAKRPSALRRLRGTASDVGQFLGRFKTDESGNMSFLAVIGSLSLIAFGGIGIDLMYTEMKRTKVQATLDRAVLAATDLEQGLVPQDVMQDYFDKMQMPDALTSVTVNTGLNYRNVTGTAYVGTPSNFTAMLGLDTLVAEGTSSAEERISNVEISLVLDISGSMEAETTTDGTDVAAGTTKIEMLQTATNTFLDTVLTTDNADLVSVSLVPYSERVNVGPDIASNLNVNWRHGYSHCLEFPQTNFDSVSLDTSQTFEQAQHYQWNFYGYNHVDDTVCPQYSYERVTPFSQDINALKKQVGDLQPRAGTSIFLGMKWGAALLDPSMRSINSTLAANGVTDTAFSTRPAEYDDENTLKTIVLMTDGQNSNSYRISDFAYNAESEYAHWASNNFWYYLQTQVEQKYWGYYYYQKYNAELGDILMANICNAAKEAGIVVWSIGFEVTDHGAQQMANCASSPAHFFRVEGAELEKTFYSIGRAINQLRLTQ